MRYTQIRRLAPRGAVKAVTEQVIATGPVASQLSIKQIGTNGGGYFNVNSAHPYENPKNGDMGNVGMEPLK